MAAPRSAPLAGRPPYATDEDDSIYDNPAPRTRAARPPVDNPNDRTSAYNTYDSYLDNRSSNVSGSAGIGGALLAIDSDSDDETDLHSVPPQRNADTGSRAALYAAASGLNNPPPHSLSPTRSPTSPAPPYSPPANGQTPTDSKRGPGMSPPRSPGASSSSPAGGPLVSPRPVYAANTPSRQAAFDVNSRQPQHQPPNLSVRIPASPSANLRADVASRGPAVPSPAFMAPPANGGAGTPSTAGFGPIPGTPNELHPHPLQAPSTPITPIFAAPPRTVNFDDKSFNTPILRGDKEETLIARRGDKGDDFWRRFSMVAKEENSKPANQKTSQWLRSTQAGRSGFSRCVWVVAVILVLSIVGASVAGWYFTRNNPDHVRPTTFGGTAEEGMNGRGTSSVPTTSTTSSGGLVKIVHTSTSAAAAAVATEAKRSENDGLERIVARAFGQVASDMSAEKRDLPVVVKKVRQHQHAKRRTWQRMI